MIERGLNFLIGEIKLSQKFGSRKYIAREGAEKTLSIDNSPTKHHLRKLIEKGRISRAITLGRVLNFYLI